LAENLRGSAYAADAAVLLQSDLEMRESEDRIWHVGETLDVRPCL
jgi:hypothetical protein